MHARRALSDFGTAQNLTNAGGVISVLDPGDYTNGVYITKSLTIRAEGVDGGATFLPASGFLIIVVAGASDVVTLEGLHFNGAGSIAFNSGGHLHVVRCVFTNSNVSGQAGIKFQPNSASKLSVTDTVISNMGSGTGGGIVVNPQAGGSARVNLERVSINGNAFGIAADGTGSTAGINMTIADSMVGGNSQDGIIAVTPSGGAPIGVMVTNTKSCQQHLRHPVNWTERDGAGQELRRYGQQHWPELLQWGRDPHLRQQRCEHQRH